MPIPSASDRYFLEMKEENVPPPPEPDAPKEVRATYLRALMVAQGGPYWKAFMEAERIRLGFTDQKKWAHLVGKVRADMANLGRYIRAAGDVMLRFADLHKVLTVETEPEWEQKVNAAHTMFPSLMPIAYPRRYATPAGYISPKVLMFPMAMAAFYATEYTTEALEILTDSQTDWLVNGQKVDCPVKSSTYFQDRYNSNGSDMKCSFALSRLAGLRVPTYFVGENMAKAVCQTDLPRDFSLAEVPWPLDALMYMLPKGIASAPYGEWLATIIVARITPGTYAMPNPYTGLEAELHMIKDRVHSGPDECYVCGISSTGRIYTWICPLEGDMHNAASAESMAGTSADVEWTFVNKTLSVLGLQLLLTMVACPELVETRSRVVTPKRKLRGGVIEREVWSPNFFGRHYMNQQSTAAAPGDADAKRRMHWRRGHFRRQRFGAGRTQIKIIWIEPVLINPEST